MPVISRIGQKDWRVRLVIVTIYAILGLGALSMLYPLMLMLSMSITSQTDFYSVTPLPQYLFRDEVLWAKYVESKYLTIPDAEKAQFSEIGNWREVELPEMNDELQHRVEQFVAFRQTVDWPTDWYRAGHLGLGQNARAYVDLVQDRFRKDIVAYSSAIGVRYKSWSQVLPPDSPMDARYFMFPDTVNYQMLNQLKAAIPFMDRFVINLDGVYWNAYLRPRWATIEQYNEAHGTIHQSYQQVLLHRYPPEVGPARDDWEDFVRNDLNLAYIRLNPTVEPAFQSFLTNRYRNDIEELNRQWHTRFSTFDQITLMQRIDGTSRVYLDYAQFLSDKERCPTEALSIYGPRQGFEEYLAKQQRVPLSRITPNALPIVEVDYLDFKHRTGFLRWEFVKRNYLKVLDYILLHGNGVRNTIIYCILMIVVTLTINPLAAYALSRYKPPSTYKILLFCMCTMAFPPEVTMIPSFLLLKRFPAIGLGVTVIVGLVAGWVLHKVAHQINDAFKGILAGVIGLTVGFYLLPLIFGVEAPYVSLLNTYWALILPGAANGFGIFLLKGFFDSLPQELYESAEIDGGGEFTKFWTITMSLSKPILAVLALNAFTAAYSEFLMALVIIPDQRMWTLMVWLFQLQRIADPYVVNASIVLAAIPTFLIFLFCQNIIMRGIVVPVEK
ncbi:MAG: ABC transporter permease subunit [Phycisphaeraceae bacterium]|nr:ABC transporter permease subunit [Phycisphaeraceae bacterium]